MHFGRPLSFAVLVALLLCASLVSCENSSPSLPRQRRDVGLQARAPTTTGVDVPVNTGDAQTADAKPSDAKPSDAKTSDVSTHSTKTTSEEHPATTAASSLNASATGKFMDEFGDIEDSTVRAVYKGGLPITPKVTPGIGVAGIFLMLAGLCCCLVGIKIQRLHIFLSTAYLTSLAVTVLIIYVMNPPTKDAIQGGYVVAAIVTGLILGGLAVIFPEVTEGLGCLLGGFCVSMWFLVLKPGGLVSSVYGKLVLIAAFCIAIFSFAFHRVTRPWGLIVSLSFSGSTSLVLGIDCYSRAGVTKEFWLYIWALNDKLFPLGTDTYPHTRGMKVEIAAIVIVFAVGVMSQMKLWKILQGRREAKLMERRRQAADLEAVDAATGARVEAEFQVERQGWEATYGDQCKSGGSSNKRPPTSDSKADSGLGDDATTVRASGETSKMSGVSDLKAAGETVELVELSSTPEKPVDGEHPENPGEEVPVPVSIPEGTPEEIAAAADTAADSTDATTTDSTAADAVATPAAEDEAKPEVTPAPVVIPLPLPILPTTEDGEEEKEEEDVFSIATRADSDHYSGIAVADTDGTMPLNMPYNRISNASSLAATCDDRLDDDDDLSEWKRNSIISTLEPEHEATKDEDDANSTGDATVVGPKHSEETAAAEAESEDKKIVPEGDAKDPALNDSTDSASIPESTPSAATKVKVAASGVLPQDLLPASYPKAKTNSSGSRKSNFEIQTQCSRVVKTYRTNEWAKHLSEADKPELDELTNGDEEDKSGQQPAHLDIRELQGIPEVPTKTAATITPTPPTPPPAAVTLPPTAVTPPAAAVTAPPPLIRRVSSIPKPIPEEPVAAVTEQPPSPGIQQQRPVSTDPAQVQTMQPFPLVARATSSAAVRNDEGFAKNTLLGQRENMVRNRASFNATPSPISTSPVYAVDPMRPSGSPVYPITDPMRSASALGVARPSGSPVYAVDPMRSSQALGYGRAGEMNTQPRPGMSRQNSGLLGEDMTMADRPRLSQQLSTRRSWNPPVGGAQAGGRSSPMPQQAHKRAEVWREGIRAEVQQTQEVTSLVDQRRAEMMDERNHVAMQERQKKQMQLSGKLRGPGMMTEERMRQKDMLELHQEALRRMQAEANRRTRQAE